MVLTVETTIPFALISSIIALAYGLFTVFKIKSMKEGSDKMMEISNAIREGANAFLKRQYGTVALIAIAIFVLFLALGFLIDARWMFVGASFAVGAFFSALSGFIGMKVTTLSNSRTAEAAKQGLGKAMNVSFKAGSVMGLAVVGFGLLGVTTLYLAYKQFFPLAEESFILNLVIGMGFGASLVALFARVGGGIYTKGADVGADLVGKIEAGIPEDDPRNPAVIADNVGDNVGDCAGMGADLFESYVVTIIGTMLLGNLVPELGINGILFPLAISGAAIIASIFSTFFVKVKEEGEPMKALNFGVLISVIISALLFYVLGQNFFYANKFFGIFLASLTGLIIAMLVVWITDYFTSTKHKPVQEIAMASKTGAGTNIITGLAVGLESTAPTLIVVVIGIFLAYFFAGIYGIAIASMAMLSLTGIIVTIDTFGPITDNAGGIVEMAGLKESVRSVTDKLDSVGNTTKATTKGFAIASAALAALALLLAYAEEVKLAVNPETGFHILNIMNPLVLIGLFVGAGLPFLFSAMLMKAVGQTASDIVNEVRRQFKENPGIMKGTQKPSYSHCVDISTKSAIRELTKPAMLAVGSPILVGFLFGKLALGGLLAGSIASGFLLALQMATGGGAWDNAKKLIEEGAHGGKGSEAHKAAVVGDTVGDPFKDTAGPSINSLIKVLNTLAIILAAILVTATPLLVI